MRAEVASLARAVTALWRPNLLGGMVTPKVWHQQALPMQAKVASLARAVTALWRPNLLGGLVTPKVWPPQASPTQGGQGG